MRKEEIISAIEEKRLPVVISGAGVVGQVLLSVCQKEGIAVECFCDSSIKVAQADFCGKEVVYTPDLKRKYTDAIVLIAVASIGDVVNLLDRIGFQNWYAGGLLLDGYETSQGTEIDYTKFAVENCILCHKGYLNPDKLFLRSVDVIITERCSLRCKNCSNLMQYYEKPKHYDTPMLLKSIDAMCSIADEVMDFRIIGGEAFLNPDWPVIVKRLTEEPKAIRVVIYTNGTIIPRRDAIQYLANSKILVVITDYGALSVKIQQLRDMLKSNNVAHHVLKVEEWLDCASISPHRRRSEQNKKLFELCCAKNMASLSVGKLFRCPYAANAARLSAVPDYKEDYIDLLNEPMDAANLQNTRAKVRDYLFHRDYLETCDFCSGRPLSGTQVAPAVQVAKPVRYQKYAAC